MSGVSIKTNNANRVFGCGPCGRDFFLMSPLAGHKPGMRKTEWEGMATIDVCVVHVACVVRSCSCWTCNLSKWDVPATTTPSTLCRTAPSMFETCPVFSWFYKGSTKVSQCLSQRLPPVPTPWTLLQRRQLLLVQWTSAFGLLLFNVVHGQRAMVFVLSLNLFGSSGSSALHPS